MQKNKPKKKTSLCIFVYSLIVTLRKMPKFTICVQLQNRSVYSFNMGKNMWWQRDFVCAGISLAMLAHIFPQNLFSICKYKNEKSYLKNILQIIEFMFKTGRCLNLADCKHRPVQQVLF